jgi:hypothetical protein
LRCVQVRNLRFELLVVGSELLDSLLGAGNIDIRDIEADDVAPNSDQYRNNQQPPAWLGRKSTIQPSPDRSTWWFYHRAFPHNATTPQLVSASMIADLNA